jgi:hypothetical protein
VTRYRIKDIVESAVDFMIRKTNYPESVHLQKFSAFGVVCGATIRSMLAAVQFNDQSGLETYEIRNIRTDRLLAAEFETCELTAAQGKPQFALDIGLFAPQFPGKFVFHCSPLTRPPPRFARQRSPSTGRAWLRARPSDPIRGEGMLPTIKP